VSSLDASSNYKDSQVSPSARDRQPFRCSLNRANQKEAIRKNVAACVIDIREDEIVAIIREIKKREANCKAGFTSSEIVAMLRDRLPKRP
jgi:hypothetical protein